jgi:acetate kinase
MKILVLNSGSSSQKACLYEIGAMPAEIAPMPLWEGRIEWRNDSVWISVKNQQGGTLKEKIPASSREQVLRRLLRTARDGKTRAIRFEVEIDVVGHRVVHGGAHLADPVAITPEVCSAIESVSAIAPLHVRAELEGVRLLQNILGHAGFQCACSGDPSRGRLGDRERVLETGTCCAAAKVARAMSRQNPSEQQVRRI